MFPHSYSTGPAEGLFHRVYAPHERIQPAPADAAPRFLILRMSAIGDVVISSPVARELKRRYPRCLVVAGVEEKSEAVVRMNPYVDEIFLFKVQTFKKQIPSLSGLPHTLQGFRDLSECLRGYRFNVTIDMHTRFRSAALMRISQAPVRIGYDMHREGSGLFYTHRVPLQPLKRPGEDFTHLLEPLGIHDADPSLLLQPPPEARATAERLFNELGVDPARCVALCPATTVGNKHWAEEGWAEVADRLIENCGLQPVLLGAKADLPLIGRIQDRMRRPVPVLAGRTTMEESVAVVRALALTISVDTALAHVSYAVGTPVIILHGSTPYDRMQCEPNVTIVAAPDACGGTQKYPCPNCRCMMKIQPEDVIQAVQRLILRSSDHTRT